MKRFLCVVVIVISLVGCGKNEGLDKGVRLRNAVLQGEGYSFTCAITADYGQNIYEFSEHCDVDANGNLQFQVVLPESISGITGLVDGNGGKLSFDDEVLAFPLLADGLLTPVSAPWFFAQALTKGYIAACEDSSDRTKIIVQDNYKQASIETHIYCLEDTIPCFAEIFWEGRKIITLQIDNFTIL